MTRQSRGREHRLLAAVEQADAAAVFVQGSAEPVLRDLGFQCFGCKRVSLSPPLPAGMALPPRVVMSPPGRYLISGTVELRRVVMVGQAAVDRRQVEAGPRGATFGGAPVRHQRSPP